MKKMKKYLSKIACVITTASLCLSGTVIPINAENSEYNMNTDVQIEDCDLAPVLHDYESEENIEPQSASDYTYDHTSTDGVKYGRSSNGKLWVIGYENNISKSVSLESNTYGIADNALYNCSKIKNITMNEGLAEIGSNALSGCIKITSLTIPSSVTSIADDAFRDMTSLEKFEGYNSRYACYDYTLIDMYQEKLIQYPLGNSTSDYYVPSYVTSIGNYAFANQKYLKSVGLGNKTTEVGLYAFENCTALESVDLASVNTLYYGCFRGCSSLTNITIPNTIINIYDNIFSGCISLESIYVVPGAESGIHSSNGALYGKYDSDGSMKKALISYPAAASMTQYNIEYDTEIIGNDAFDCPRYLEKLVFNDELKEIQFGGVSGGLKLKEIVTDDNLEKIGDCAFQTCRKLEKINLGKNVTEIGQRAFYACILLKSVNIPAKVNTIGKELFGRCSALEEITVSPDNATFTSVDGVLFDKNVTKLIAYPTAKVASEYVIPSTTTDITVGAFIDNNIETFKVADGNTAYKVIDGVLFTTDNILFAYPAGNSAKSYTVPDGTVRIEDDAFEYAKLESITFNEGLKSIGEYAFWACQNMKSYDLPSSLETIGVYALGYNKVVETITIPANVTTIGRGAFASCTNLDYITFLGENTPSVATVDDRITDYDAALRYVYVPKGKQIEYTNWLGGKLYPGAMIVEGTKVSLADTHTAISDLPESITTADKEQVTYAKNAFVRLNNKEKESIADDEILKLEKAVKITYPRLWTETTIQNGTDNDNTKVTYKSMNAIGLNVSSRKDAEGTRVYLDITPETPQGNEVARFSAEYTIDYETAQPLSPIVMEMTISDDIKDKELIVKHYNEDGTLKEDIQPKIDGNKLSFRTYSFSPFAIEVASAEPTVAPTVAPTATPTVAPTATPTVAPTTAPTATATATVAPTTAPTATATATVAPTTAPTATATAEPTTAPTTAPSVDIAKLSVDQTTGTATVTVNNAVKNASLIVAGYKNGVLTGINIVKKDFAVGDTASVTLNSMENVDKVSAFFWNIEEDKLIPLCDSVK